MTESAIGNSIVVLVLCLLGLLAYRIDQMHTEGFNKCMELNGLWLDREMKCIEAKELK
jgi:hypothetical protein